MLSELAADDLTELVELYGVEDTHRSRSGVVYLHCHGGLCEEGGGQEWRNVQCEHVHVVVIQIY